MEETCFAARSDSDAPIEAAAAERAQSAIKRGGSGQSHPFTRSDTAAVSHAREDDRRREDRGRRDRSRGQAGKAKHRNRDAEE